MDSLPQHLLFARIYPHLSPRDLASASRACGGMRVELPQSQDPHNPWTIATRASLPVVCRPSPDRAFAELRDAFSRHVAAQRSYEEARPRHQLVRWPSALYNKDCLEGAIVSGRGRYAARADSYGSVAILDIPGRQERITPSLTAGTFNPIKALAWYDDERCLAVAFRNGELASLRVDGLAWTSIRRLRDDDWAVVSNYAAFSPDMSHLARTPTSSAAAPLQIIALDLCGNQATIAAEFPGEVGMRDLDWSPSGKFLGVADDSGFPRRVRVIDVLAAQVIHTLDFGDCPNPRSGWCAGREWIFVAEVGSPDLKTFGPSGAWESSRALDLSFDSRFGGHLREPIQVEPGGDLLALTVFRRGVALCDVRHPGRSWHISEPDIFSVRWAPTGRWLALSTSRGELHLLDGRHPERGALPMGPSGLTDAGLTWTTDGYHLIAVSKGSSPLLVRLSFVEVTSSQGSP